MKKSRLLGAVCACLLIVSFNTSAALVSVDWKTFGDNLITQDADSGLEWLDVTETTSMSFNDVSSQFGVGGTFEGWRYASMSEVTSFWNAAGGNQSFYTTGWNSANNGLTSTVGSFTGFTRIDSETVGSLEIFALTSFSPEAGKHQNSLLWDNEGLPGNVGLDYTNLEHPAVLDSTSATSLGSWLVRETSAVPIPAALYLFGTGLLGLIGIARRRS